MEILDHVDHLTENYSGVFLVEIAVFLQTLEKLASFAIILNEVEIFVVFKNLIEFDDVGVIELTKDLYFRLEGFWIFDVLFGDDLDDSVFVGGLDHSSQVYDSIGTSSEGFLSELVQLLDVFFSCFDEEVFFNNEFGGWLGLHYVFLNNLEK